MTSLNGWIMPNGQFVSLNTADHERYLQENADFLNGKFRTGFSHAGNMDLALRAGFVRFRLLAGGLHVEVNIRHWSKSKRGIVGRLFDCGNRIDGFTLSLLNEAQIQVDSVVVNLQGFSGGPQKFEAIQEAAGSLRGICS